MNAASSNLNQRLPGLRLWAYFTAAAVLPLVALGGLVTSMRVGMADPTPVREPWYMLFLNWRETIDQRGIGYLVEHGHRQLGWLVGLLTIILAVWMWRALPMSRSRWLGFVALAAVSLQGVLGIARVYFDRAGYGIEFAMIHGYAGQVTFAFLACLPLVVTARWQQGDIVESPDAARLYRLSVLTLVLMLVQLGAGVWLRQLGAGVWVHIGLAVAVVAHCLLLAIRVHRQNDGPRRLLALPAKLLAALVLGQFLLGLAAWWEGGGVGAMDPTPIAAARAALATTHVALGAVILATMGWIVLQVCRHLPLPRRSDSLIIHPSERTA